MEEKDYLLINNYWIWNIENDRLVKNEIFDGMMIDRKIKVFTGDDVKEANSAKFEKYKWIFYDEIGDEIRTDDLRMAYTGHHNIKPLNYIEESYGPEDENLIKAIADNPDEQSLELYKKSLKKISYDFDNDGVIESIYTMMNYLFGGNIEKPTSYMYMIKNGEVKDILKDININIYNVVDIILINDIPYIFTLKGLADPITYKDKNKFIITILEDKFTIISQ